MDKEKILDDLEAWRDEAPERRAIIAIAAERGDDNKTRLFASINVEGITNKRVIINALVVIMKENPGFRQYMLLADSILKGQGNCE